MQTTRPHITWKDLPMARIAIFKEIFDQVRKDLDCELFYSTLQTSQRLTLYLLSHRQYSHHIENDNTVLIKGLKRL